MHGLETYPGLFPWHAALYFSEVGSLKYICGGSLISMSSVLTAGSFSLQLLSLKVLMLLIFSSLRDNSKDKSSNKY